ncbi:UPF0149 family protein [Alteromonas antoniana]|uniref:UPF0149 family protein n=1 Tax=Alteromonas antoniana TaxID=2803813 RepID=UPI0030846D19
MKTLQELSALPKFSAILPSYYEMDGMIFAVAASPEIPMPETWMPWLIQHSGSTMVSEDVDELAECLMETLRNHLSAMRTQDNYLPLTCRWQQGATIPESLELWLGGLLKGHQLLESIWRNAWERKAKKENLSADEEDPATRLARCLKLFSTLARHQLALSQRSGENAEKLRANLPVLWRQLPAMLQEYVTLSGDLAQALPNQFEMYNKIPDA